jgi:IS5 family transposase
VSQVSIPQRGGQKTAERQALESSPAFKKGQRFRAAMEGRISVLFGGRSRKRCRAQGLERFEVLVGAAVLANNLLAPCRDVAGRPTGAHQKEQHDLPPASAVAPSRAAVRPLQLPVPL